jgi:acyl-CoA synthetase (AMP-forming)/AMP-acid ligase II
VPPADANIARHLALMAARQPAAPALKIPRGTTRAGDIDYLALTFAELDAEAAAWHARLSARGVRPGDRVLVMVRQGLPLIASVFALFRLGAVPVVIDPGMGRKNFLAAVARTRPRALVGIPFALLLSHLFRPSFASVAVRVCASGQLTARLTSMQESGVRSQEPVAATPSEIRNLPPSPPSAVRRPHFSAAPSDLAAVLFTSGSTGAPKGVRYTHGNFDAQVRLVRDTYGITPGEVDLPLLPIFALFNPALGMTTIVPELNPRRPAELDAARIVRAIRQENVTNSFGSPTLWGKIARFCVAENITLPSLRRVLCAGAPVPAALWQSSRAWMPNGRLHSPYGMTEALPIATISSDDITALSENPKSEIQNSIPHSALRTPHFTGTPVGRPIPGIQVKIIAPTDSPLASLADARELPSGEPGEIIVAGPVVTESYDAQPEATALAKISSSPVSQLSTLNSRLHPAPTVWHRTGDIGRLDAAGLLWFHGRKAERVHTAAGPLDTETCERVFRAHPRAARCALIGLGERPAQIPALVAETAVKNSREARALARELRELARAHPHTAAIQTFYFREKFPVDVRHNAKIHRLTLARWAATATGFASDPKR